MSFWSQTSATPSFWQMSGLVALTPQYLRTTAPDKIPNPMLDTQIIRIGPEHQTSFAFFLEAHYGGGDWTLRCRDWISRYINDSNVIILCLVHRESGEILASIMSVPFTEGVTYMSHGAELRNVRVIEGLCVRHDMRSKGVAGIMINQMDIRTYAMFGPTTHLWAREQSYSPSALFITSAINTRLYGYIRCTEARPRILCSQMDWNMFTEYWKSCCRLWLTGEPAIVAELPTNRRGDITVWTGNTRGHEHDVVVISHTRRRSGELAIYEVVWCGFVKEGRLYPANKWVNYGTLIESVASKHSGIFFATDEYVPIWTTPWTFGTSGYHSWYLYNYLPPAFGACKIHAIREEV